MFLGLVSFYVGQTHYAIDISLLIYLGWTAVCLLVYAVVSYAKEDSSDFDFYKASAQGSSASSSSASSSSQPAVRKKYNTEERVGIFLDQDGLDPMVIFNEEKSGVVSIVKVTGLPLSHKLTELFSELSITSQQIGHPIDSQTIFKLSFEGMMAYCRLTTGDENEILEFAFPKNSPEIYAQLLMVVQKLMEQNSGLEVIEINVLNYQALLKFYNYVKRLNAPENRSIEYISHYQGNLKICNSSYVELYDCTLQSTITSWVNQDGLIRTDNVDIVGEEQMHLENIDLPYEERRLVNIQLGKAESTDVVTLYLTLSELTDGELTGNSSPLTLVMKDDCIEIKQDAMAEEELISIQEYFDQKCYQKF